MDPGYMAVTPRRASDFACGDRFHADRLYDSEDVSGVVFLVPEQNPAERQTLFLMQDDADGGTLEGHDIDGGNYYGYDYSWCLIVRDNNVNRGLARRGVSGLVLLKPVRPYHRG